MDVNKVTELVKAAPVRDHGAGLIGWMAGIFGENSSDSIVSSCDWL